jgi:hypothetical protein
MKVAARKLRVEDAAKLQALIVENFDAIEPGLTVLDARLLLGHATIDVIGVDAVGTLVLCAVGFSANEEMLLKAVEAYSWCLEYPEGLVRLYPGCQLSEERPPRLLFVVERMPDAFQRKIKQLGFPEVDCVEFRHLEFDGVPTVYFESLLRLRRSRMVDADAPTAPANGAGAATENVITMNGASARGLSVKPPKHVTQASPDAATNGPRAADRVAPAREPSPVVSMVSRQATVPVPRVDRPRPVTEPVVLREPEPLIAAPVVETLTVAEPEPDVVAAALEFSIVPEPATEPLTLPELPEVPVRPFVVDAVPSMVPAHVTTAAAERVSFKDLATALLGATTATQETLVQVVAAATPPDGAEPLALKAVSEPIAFEPVVVEPIVASLELVLESSVVEKIETPLPLVQSPALDEIVALAAAPLPVEAVAPVIESPEPPALTLETVAAIAGLTPAAREREVAESAKPAAPPVPQGFEGLKFPNDGVLTRQWMEFLSQMSASK